MRKRDYWRDSYRIMHRLALLTAGMLSLSACSGGEPMSTAGDNDDDESSQSDDETPDESSSDDPSSTGSQDNSSGESNESSSTSSDESTDDSTSDSSETDDTDSTDDSELPDNDDEDLKALESLVEAICSWGDRCCTLNEFAYIFGPAVDDVASCTERMMYEITDGDDDGKFSRVQYGSGLLFDLAFHVDLDRSKIQRDAVELCKAEYEDKECFEATPESPQCTQFDDDDHPCTLRKLFHGRLDSGDTCSEFSASENRDIECRVGRNCVKDTSSAGRFRCKDVGQLDETCSPDAADPTGDCDNGLYCSFNTGRCVARPTEGEACAYRDEDLPTVGDEKIPCAEGLSCSISTQKCVARCDEHYRCAVESPDGEIAIPGADAELCGDRLSCIPIQNSEDASIYHYSCQKPRKITNDCDSHADCEDGLYCNRPAPGEVGQCEPRLTEGMGDCNDDHEACAEGLYCDGADQCSIPILAGSSTPCTSHDMCGEGSIGCVEDDAGAWRCLEDLLEKDAPCDEDVGVNELPHPRFSALPFDPDDGIIGVDDFRYWGNFCASQVCEFDGAGMSCADGVEEGGNCDNDPESDTLSTCLPGLQCVSGKCTPFLGGGAECEPKSQADIAQCHYDLVPMMGELRCETVHGENRCGLKAPDTRGSYCSGK